MSNRPRKGTNIICAGCGKIFYVQPHIIKSVKTPTCSYKCMGIAKAKEYIEQTCFYCKKSFKVPPSVVKWDKIRGHKYKFCSVKCHNLFNASEMNPKKKIPLRIIKGKYVLVRAPKNYPNKVGRIYAYEHRLLMEQKIGRFLNFNENVHHINHNSLDNRIENLRLISSYDHGKYHSDLRKRNDKNQYI